MRWQKEIGFIIIMAGVFLALLSTIEKDFNNGVVDPPVPRLAQISIEKGDRTVVIDVKADDKEREQEVISEVESKGYVLETIEVSNTDTTRNHLLIFKRIEG